jgi:hypothetical protein
MRHKRYPIYASFPPTVLAVSGSRVRAAALSQPVIRHPEDRFVMRGFIIVAVAENVKEEKWEECLY